MAGVVWGLAGLGSDFSEVSTLGLESAALEPAAAPACPPGPVTCTVCGGRFWSFTSWRWTTSDSRRLSARIASIGVLPAASLRR